jgi:hypothetical protein
VKYAGQSLRENPHAMALGQLPGDGVDRAVMARTLDAVLTSWDWETKIWGWDSAPTLDAPGFPRDGTWVVRSEGLRPLP